MGECHKLNWGNRCGFLTFKFRMEDSVVRYLPVVQEPLLSIFLCKLKKVSREGALNT